MSENKRYQIRYYPKGEINSIMTTMEAKNVNIIRRRLRKVTDSTATIFCIDNDETYYYKPLPHLRKRH